MTLHPGLPAPAADTDRAAIRRVIEAWGFARDGGEWDALADTFHPDGRIAVSWFSGTFADFVAACRANRGRSFSKHVMCGGRVALGGDRAVAETDVLLFTRGTVEGVEVETRTNMRFLDRFERRGDGVWRAFDRVALYDHDSMAPVIPGAPIPLDPAELVGLAPGHRFLAWRLRRAGRTIPDDLPGPGTPEEAARRAECDAWLGRAP